MVARYSGATLGLFAFAVTLAAGLIVRNPVSVTLSRAIVALFLFCALGMVLGWTAQRVLGEFHQTREAQLRAAARARSASDDAQAVDASSDGS